MSKATEDFRMAHNISAAASLITVGSALAGVAATTNPVTAPIAIPVMLGGLGIGAITGHFAKQNEIIAREQMNASLTGEAVNVAEPTHDEPTHNEAMLGCLPPLATPTTLPNQALCAITQAF